MTEEKEREELWVLTCPRCGDEFVGKEEEVLDEHFLHVLADEANHPRGTEHQMAWKTDGQRTQPNVETPQHTTHTTPQHKGNNS